MTLAPVLRQARVADAEEISRLSAELGYAADVAVMRERLAVLTSHPDHRISVLEEGNTLLGWISIEHRRTLQSGERIEIVGLVVDSRFRGTGIGRTLVSDAERWARERGLGTICVRSNVERDISHPFYERLGYVRRKTQHFYSKLL